MIKITKMQNTEISTKETLNVKQLNRTGPSLIFWKFQLVHLLEIP